MVKYPSFYFWVVLPVFNMIRIGHVRVLGLLTFFVLTIGMFLVGGRVCAQETNDSTEAYKRTVGEAVHEYDLEHWSIAIELFQRAYEIKPNARALRGMGLAAFEDQRYVDSVRWLSESLAHSVQPLTGAMRDEIKPVLTRALEYVGYYSLNHNPSDIAIEIDGRPAYIQDGKLKVDPGERQLMATAEGFEPLKRTLNVRGGDNGLLGIQLEPVASPAAAAPVPPPPVAAVEPQTVEDASPAQSSGGTILPWVLIGAGGVAAAAGGVLIGLMVRDYHAVKGMKGSYTPDQMADKVAAKDRVPLFSGAGFGLAGVGVLSAAVGVVMLVSHEVSGETAVGVTDAAEPAASSRLQVRFGLASISVKGDF